MFDLLFMNMKRVYLIIAFTVLLFMNSCIVDKTTPSTFEKGKIIEIYEKDNKTWYILKIKTGSHKGELYYFTCDHGHKLHEIMDVPKSLLEGDYDSYNF